MKEVRTKKGRCAKQRREPGIAADMGSNGMGDESSASTPTSTAHRAIQYLRRHGLTITEGWRINGEPPSDVRDYLDGKIAACFPSDEDEVEEQVIALIENDLE